MPIEYLDEAGGPEYLSDEENAQFDAENKSTRPTNAFQAVGQTVGSLLFGPTDEYKQDFTRGLQVISEALPIRSAVSKSVPMVDAASDLYLGATEKIYDTIGMQDAATEVDGIRRRSMAASSKLDAWNKEKDKESAIGPYWAGIARQADANIFESMAAGTSGAGLPALSNYYAVKETQESLKRNPDNKWLAATHGAVEGLITRWFGETLRPSSAKLAGVAELEANALVSRAIAKVKQRVPLGKAVDAMAGMGAEVVEELATESGHYFSDVAAGVEKFDLKTYGQRMQDVVAATVVTAGAAESIQTFTETASKQHAALEGMLGEELGKAETSLADSILEQKRTEATVAVEKVVPEKPAPTKTAAKPAVEKDIHTRLSDYAIKKSEFDAAARERAAAESGQPAVEPAIEETQKVEQGKVEAGEKRLTQLVMDLEKTTDPAHQKRIATEMEDVRALVAESYARLAGPETAADPSIVPPRTRAQRRIDHLTGRLNRANTRVQEVKAEYRQNKVVRRESVSEAMAALREALPPSARAGLMLQAARVETPAQLDKFFDTVDDTFFKYDKKLAAKELQASVKRARKVVANPEARAKIDDVLSPVDMRSPRTRKDLQALKDYVGQNPQADIPPGYTDAIKQLDKKPIKDMTAAEVRDLAGAINAISGHSGKAQQFATISKDVTVDHLSQQIMGEVAVNKPRITGLVGRVGSVISNALIRPEEIMRGLSESLRTLAWENIGVIGNRNYLGLKNKVTSDTTQFLASQGLSAERSLDMVGRGATALNNWRHESKYVGGQEMTRAEALHLYLLALDPQARQRLMENGASLPRTFRRMAREVIAGERTATVDFNEGTIRELGDFLGERGRAVAQHLFTQVNTRLRDAVNTAWQEKYGAPLSTRDDYFPIVLDKDWVEAAKDTENFFKNFQQATIESFGVLKKRGGTNAPLEVRDAFDVFDRHVDTTARIAAYLNPVSDFHKVAKRADVKNAIIGATSAITYDGLLEAVNQQVMPVADSSRPAKLLRRVTRGVGVGLLGMRLTTPFYNVNGLIAGSQYIPNGEKIMAQAILAAANPETANRVEATARRMSPVWEDRFDNFLHQATSGVAGENHSYQPTGVDSATLAHIKVADKFASIVRWLAAEAHVEQNRGINSRNPKFNDEVAKEWERMLYRTESTSNGLEANGALRYGRANALAAPFVQFESGASKNRSLLMKAKNDFSQGNYRSGVTASAAYASNAVWVAMIGALFAATKGKDEEKFLDRLAGRTLNDLGPVVGEAAQDMWRSARGLKVYNGSTTAVGEQLAAALEGAQGLTQAFYQATMGELNDEGDPKYAETAITAGKKLAAVAATVGGLPVSAMPGDWESLKYVFHLNLDGETGDEIAKALVELDGKVDIKQPRGKMWKAYQTQDDALFLEAAREVLRADPARLSLATFKGVVDSKFTRLSQIEKHLALHPEVQLSPAAQETVEGLQADREDVTQAMVEMVKRNLGAIRAMAKEAKKIKL